MSKRVSICYTSDDNYAHLLGVAIYSCLVNNVSLENIDIYILDNHISEINKQKLSDIMDQFNCEYYFIDVTRQLKEIVDSSAYSYGGYSTYARIYINQLLPDTVQKLLYIDTDTLIRRDIGHLFDLEFHNCIIAAVKDTPGRQYRQGLRFLDYDSYFNAGVIVIDMKKWRDERIEEKLLEALPLISPYAVNADQDMINVVLKNRIYSLPPAYNCMSIPLFFKTGDIYKIFGLNEDNYYSQVFIEQAVENPYIIHFNAGLGSRPWVSDGRNRYRHEWLDMYEQIYHMPCKINKSAGFQRMVHFLRANCPYAVFKCLYQWRLRCRERGIKMSYMNNIPDEIFDLQ